jgi:hypothetical protein
LEPDIVWFLKNKYLDPRFWRDTAQPTGIHTKYHRGLRLYHDHCWGAILEYTLERIAVLRGQIVHGVATRGNLLNRQSLQRCRKVLESRLPVMLQLVIKHRADDEWPPIWHRQ